MLSIVFLVVGMAGGAFCAYFLLLERVKKTGEQKRQQDTKEHALEEGLKKLREERERLASSLKEFEGRAVSFGHLKDENTVLKRDLRNVDVALRKSQMDVQLQGTRQDELDARTNALCTKYVQDSIKWMTKSLTTNNFVATKQRLAQVIDDCRKAGFSVSQEQEDAHVSGLKAEFERIVRAAFEREEQARIKAQIRDQQKLEREIKREIEQLDREKAAIHAALEKALGEAQGKHSEEIERLKARLAEAEAKSQRAQSMAEMTKAGHVYVISNIGSFGEGVFKVGMTRRLEPEMRVRELGDASVPFPFDVHMMISCEDAPSLENALHRALHRARLNRINPRKEFFRSDIDEIRKIVEDNHGEVVYTADPEALEYRQSLTMTEEDSEFIEGVLGDVEEDQEAPLED
jgi:hypothetical protein